MGTDQDNQPNDGELAEKPLSPEDLAQIEAQAAEDAAAFGMEGAVSKSVYARCRSKSSAAAAARCSISGWQPSAAHLGCARDVHRHRRSSFMALPQPNADAERGRHRQEEAPNSRHAQGDRRARIKNIDREHSTIKLLTGPGKYQTFRITLDDTEFREASGGCACRRASTRRRWSSMKMFFDPPHGRSRGFAVPQVEEVICPWIIEPDLGVPCIEQPLPALGRAREAPWPLICPTPLPSNRKYTSTALHRPCNIHRARMGRYVIRLSRVLPTPRRPSS